MFSSVKIRSVLQKKLKSLIRFLFGYNIIIPQLPWAAIFCTMIFRNNKLTIIININAVGFFGNGVMQLAAYIIADLHKTKFFVYIYHLPFYVGSIILKPSVLSITFYIYFFTIACVNKSDDDGDWVSYFQISKHFFTGRALRFFIRFGINQRRFERIFIFFGNVCILIFILFEFFYF